jgi:hypothetical protein
MPKSLVHMLSPCLPTTWLRICTICTRESGSPI